MAYFHVIRLLQAGVIREEQIRQKQEYQKNYIANLKRVKLYRQKERQYEMNILGISDNHPTEIGQSTFAEIGREYNHEYNNSLPADRKSYLHSGKI